MQCFCPPFQSERSRDHRQNGNERDPPARCPADQKRDLTGCHVKGSAVSISSLANGAFGLHRRHDTDAIKLEIDAPGCRSSVRRSTVPDCLRAEVRALTARPPVACEIANFAELCGPFEEPTLSLFLFF